MYRFQSVQSEFLYMLSTNRWIVTIKSLLFQDLIVRDLDRVVRRNCQEISEIWNWGTLFWQGLIWSNICRIWMKSKW